MHTITTATPRHDKTALKITQASCWTHWQYDQIRANDTHAEVAGYPAFHRIRLSSSSSVGRISPGHSADMECLKGWI
jgi:hypothetical protein